MTTEFHNPWRASLENCISGDNYLRSSEYRDLIEELDELYRRRAVESLLTRAEALHLNTGMPWHQAEELALSEAGIGNAEIDELIGECAGLGMDSLITGEGELRRFARAVLVHGQALKTPNASLSGGRRPSA